MAADALFRRAHQVDGLKHLVERHAGMLEHGAHLDRELLLAIAALVEAHADAGLLVHLDFADAAHAATMRADRTLRPQRRLKPGKRGFFAMEMGLAEKGHYHGFDD